MGFLDQVTSGLVKENDFELIYGVPKIGKTTFACKRENHILMDIENGSGKIQNVKRLPVPKNFSEVIAQLNELLTGKHKFETLVIDSLDHLELLVNKSACEENGWAVLSDGAFGKGGDAARSKWNLFIDLLKKLRPKMHIILIAHSIVRTVNDPMKNSPYDRHDFKLQEKSAALFKETVDAILFCTFEVLLKESASGKAKVLGDIPPTRVILTQGRASHEAGNRYSLPYRIALDYDEYKKAREAAQPESPEKLLELIKESLLDIKDEDLKKKVQESVEKANGDVKKLTAIFNKLQVVVANAA